MDITPDSLLILTSVFHYDLAVFGLMVLTLKFSILQVFDLTGFRPYRFSTLQGFWPYKVFDLTRFLTLQVFDLTGFQTCKFSNLQVFKLTGCQLYSFWPYGFDLPYFRPYRLSTSQFLDLTGFQPHRFLTSQIFDLTSFWPHSFRPLYSYQHWYVNEASFFTFPPKYFLFLNLFILWQNNVIWRWYKCLCDKRINVIRYDKKSTFSHTYWLLCLIEREREWFKDV